jgi:hypothetical protein
LHLKRLCSNLENDSNTEQKDQVFIPEIRKELTMKNPLDSITGTIISGLVLTAILAFVAKSLSGV